jgi:hypothetical protein
MACVNRRCRMYNRIRQICPSCKKASLIDYNGRQVCINRNCPSNSHVIDTCFFCQNKSFINDEALMFCTKGDCPFLLYEVRQCSFCNERTFLVHAKSCQNRNCEQFNIPVEPCERCGQNTVLPDPSAVGGKKCANDQCAMFAAADAAEMTLDSIDVSALKAMEEAPAAAAAPDPDATIGPSPDFEPSPPEPAAAAAPPEPTAEYPIMDAPPQGAGEDLPGRDAGGKTDRETVAYKRGDGGESIPAPHADDDDDEDIVIEDAPPQAPVNLELESADDGPIIEEPSDDLVPHDGEEEEVFVHQGAGSEPTPPPAAPAPAVAEPAPPAGLQSAMEEDELLEEEPDGMLVEDEEEDMVFQAAEPPAPAPAKPPPAEEPDPAGGLVEDDEEEDDVIVAGAPAQSEPAFGGSSASPGRGRPSAMVQQRPFDMSSPLTRIFQFLSDYVLKDERGMNYPLFLIIGLAGSGKTNYLTMLGDILNKRELNYHFPYEGIDIRPVQVDRILRQNPEKFRAQFGAGFDKEIQTQIQDLVYTYSNRQFSEFIQNTVWPPFTPPEEGSTYFLLTEITRKQKTIAKIATLETSGETFEEIIKGMRGGRLDLEADNPLQRVVHELLDIAAGYVILIDPAKRDNDDIYQNLFLALKEGVEPRAMNIFYRNVREKLMEKRGRQHGGVMDMIEGYMEAEKDKKKLNEAIKAKGMALQAELGPLAEGLKAPDLDLKAFFAEHNDALASLQALIKDRFPDVYERVSKKMAKKEEKDGLKLENFRDFLLNMINFALTIKNLKEIAKYLYAQEVSKAESDAVTAQETREEKEEIARTVMQQLGVSLNVEIDENLPDGREVVRFKNLKHLAIAITKTDMYPIIYPPEEYPNKKLPLCSRRLVELEDFLRILGGKTRYYNTSATGYSILKDTMFMPGHKNTLTPINVIEPIFDMLNI